MNLRLHLILIIACFTIAACESKKIETVNHSESVIDDLGNKFKINLAPNRIISLAPNLTEFIYELGLEDKLVGNTLYCNYPEEAKKIEKVGDLLSVDLEKIVALKPDIIFITVEGNTEDNYNKLKELGYNIFVSNPRNFEGIKKTIMDMAKIFGLQKTAAEKISSWQKRIDAVSAKSKNSKPLKAMFLVSLNPIILAGKNTFVNGFLEINNLKNITGDVEINYPFFSREDILERNPDIIIHTQENIKSENDLLEAYSEWSSLDAVKNDKVYYVDPDLFHRPGPRFAEAAETLYNTLNKTNP
jgi:iron complex transport system substrate-binding protein